MSASPFLPEKEWGDLLCEIVNRQVVPIIGSELVTVQDPETGEVVPYYRRLAADLAGRLGLDPREGHCGGDSLRGLNDVACRYLLSGKPRVDIYREVFNCFAHATVPVPPPLLDLAAITDFDLYITSTIDTLLIDALEQARPGFLRKGHVFAYHPKRPVDLPDPLGDTLVYQMVGSHQTHPYFAVWEEDYLELAYRLAQQRPDLPRLFSLLKERYLLFLGAPFTDWVVRFFLFVVNDGRFSDSRRDVFHSYLTDHQKNLGEPLVFFFDKVVGTTRIVEGAPSEFVSELLRRWRETRECAAEGPDLLDQMPDEIPRASVFVSYSHDDREAVLNLVRGLRSAGVPVWVDKQRLQAGENYNTSIEHAVKSECSFFLSLISKATEADTTRYVHKERRWAAERQVEGYVFYIPVVVDDTQSPHAEPQKFGSIHFDRLPGGTVTAPFVDRMKRLHDYYRVAGTPRA